jgi:hypothetical protein
MKKTILYLEALTLSRSTIMAQQISASSDILFDVTFENINV